MNSNKTKKFKKERKKTPLKVGNTGSIQGGNEREHIKIKAGNEQLLLDVQKK